MINQEFLKNIIKARFPKGLNITFFENTIDNGKCHVIDNDILFVQIDDNLKGEKIYTGNIGKIIKELNE
jgi:hypothetical protein